MEKSGPELPMPWCQWEGMQHSLCEWTNIWASNTTSHMKLMFDTLALEPSPLNFISSLL